MTSPAHDGSFGALANAWTSEQHRTAGYYGRGYGYGRQGWGYGGRRWGYRRGYGWGNWTGDELAVVGTAALVGATAAAAAANRPPPPPPPPPPYVYGGAAATLLDTPQHGGACRPRYGGASRANERGGGRASRAGDRPIAASRGPVLLKVNF